MPCLLLFAVLFSGVDYLEYIRVMTRKVCLKVLDYSVHAIWTPKSAKKVITEKVITSCKLGSLLYSVQEIA